ncbi:hypothetical protein JB92DRAFT_2824440 [Gautieria morchelliformis]|nr:hypothetical protein JB92DRAFT_2824440 [Gautieria morchelliformis]
MGATEHSSCQLHHDFWGSESGVARNIRLAHCVVHVAVTSWGGWLDPTHCRSGESDVATHMGPDSIGDMSWDSDVAGHTRLTAGLCCECEGRTNIHGRRKMGHLPLQHFNSTVKKRLHVSGLTPAITAIDISAHLQGFGKVPLDGVGALNAVGRNVLSETTWKGVKLRIGQAKLDYAQRVHAGDISIVTAPKPHSAPGVAQNLPRTPHPTNENAPRTPTARARRTHESVPKSRACKKPRAPAVPTRA